MLGSSELNQVEPLDSRRVSHSPYKRKAIHVVHVLSPLSFVGIQSPKMKRVGVAGQPKAKKAPKKLNVYEQFIDDLKSCECAQKSPQRPVNVCDFNVKQRKVYDLVESRVNNSTPGAPPLRLLVQGTAGTGKSAIINAIRSLLTKEKKKYRVCSFTGSSAYLVGGSTLHKTFRLPLFYHGSCPDALTDAGQNLKNVDFYIFDEFSLIGLHLLGYISERLNAIHGVSSPEFHFGNTNVIMFGDFSQIRPVGDRALFSKDPDDALEGLDKKGYLAYQSIKNAVILEESMRQSGPQQQAFREMLNRIRKGQLSPEDETKLSERYIRNVAPSECEKFTGPESLFLFAEKEAVNRYNNYRLNLLPTEKHVIWPIEPKGAPRGASVPLELKVGAKVFLTTNVKVEAGLYNGSMGIVTEIGPPDINGKGPQCIFVKFFNYTGPRFGIRNDIPIIRHKCPANSIVNDCTWMTDQFPLELAFSITCHKSQGHEVDKIVIGIPENENQRSMFYSQAPSLFFVALSRVKSLDHVMFTKPFTRHLVAKRYPGSHLIEWMEEEERLRQLELNM